MTNDIGLSTKAEKMELSMKGKTVLITEAGSGIRRSIAIAFSEQGAMVVVADISKKLADEMVSLITGREGKLEF